LRSRLTSCQSVPSIVWGKCTMSHICKPATDRIAQNKNFKTDQPIGELPVLLLLLLLRLCKAHLREVQWKLADLKSLLDGWQLSGRIATRASRRALPSRQYGLWVKCEPAGMRARAMGRKVKAAVLLCVEGELSPHTAQCRLSRSLPPYPVVS